MKLNGRRECERRVLFLWAEFRRIHSFFTGEKRDWSHPIWKSGCVSWQVKGGNREWRKSRETISLLSKGCSLDHCSPPTFQLPCIPIMQNISSWCHVIVHLFSLCYNTPQHLTPFCTLTILTHMLSGKLPLPTGHSNGWSYGVHIRLIII